LSGKAGRRSVTGHGCLYPIPFAQETYTIADILSDLASKSGISPDLAGKGLGAVLSAFKDHLPADSFSKVREAVPNADSMMASAQAAAPASSGGVLAAVTGAVGKLVGGGGAAALVAKLTGLGFSQEQLQKFLPNVLEFFKSNLPADIMNQITGLIPAGR
jgi:hypothetical protein